MEYGSRPLNHIRSDPLFHRDSGSWEVRAIDFVSRRRSHIDSSSCAQSGEEAGSDFLTFLKAFEPLFLLFPL